MLSNIFGRVLIDKEQLITLPEESPLTTTNKSVNCADNIGYHFSYQLVIH